MNCFRIVMYFLNMYGHSCKDDEERELWLKRSEFTEEQVDYLHNKTYLRPFQLI